MNNLIHLCFQLHIIYLWDREFGCLVLCFGANHLLRVWAVMRKSHHAQGSRAGDETHSGQYHFRLQAVRADHFLIWWRQFWRDQELKYSQVYMYVDVFRAFSERFDHFCPNGQKQRFLETIMSRHQCSPPKLFLLVYVATLVWMLYCIFLFFKKSTKWH